MFMHVEARSRRRSKNASKGNHADATQVRRTLILESVSKIIHLDNAKLNRRLINLLEPVLKQYQAMGANDEMTRESTEVERKITSMIDFCQRKGDSYENRVEDREDLFFKPPGVRTFEPSHENLNLRVEDVDQPAMTGNDGLNFDADIGKIGHGMNVMLPGHMNIDSSKPEISSRTPSPAYGFDGGFNGVSEIKDSYMDRRGRRYKNSKVQADIDKAKQKRLDMIRRKKLDEQRKRMRSREIRRNEKKVFSKKEKRERNWGERRKQDASILPWKK